MSNTKIEWTEATWNPVTGCTKLSPGCKHCYAEVMAGRLQAMGQRNYRNGFEVTPQPHMLLIPLKRCKPTTYFVNSMSDLFHEGVAFEYVAAVFGVMAATPQHTFQVLTKRPERMREFLAWLAVQTSHGNGTGRTMAEVCRDAALDAREWRALDGSMPPGPERVLQGYDDRWPLPNVWLGVSVEDRKYGLPRIDELRATPAAVRFLSVEPLLEDLGTLDLTGIDWVIVGGESGPGARPMHPNWARSIRDQALTQRKPCPDARYGGPEGKFERMSCPEECSLCNGRSWRGPAFFFKQWGEWVPAADLDVCSKDAWTPITSQRYYALPPEEQGAGMVRVGKAQAGRELDGRTWDEMPRRRA